MLWCVGLLKFYQVFDVLYNKLSFNLENMPYDKTFFQSFQLYHTFFISRRHGR